MTCETTISRSHLSQEYVTIEIVANVTLGSQAVDIAVIPQAQADPASGDWFAAAWIGSPGTTRSAQIDPSTIASFPVGIYSVWFRVTDAPEVPVEKVAYLDLT